jgi:PAS domain S-box-containing protein
MRKRPKTTRRRTAVGGARRRSPAAEDLSTRLAQALHNQQQLFVAAMRQAADGIVVCDAQGRLLLFNPAARRLADRDPEGCSLANARAVWGDCYENEDGPIPVDDWPAAHALRGETTVGRELHKRHADGTRTYIQISAAPARDAGGALIGAVVTFTDITDRKRAEEQTRRLNQELEERVRTRTAALAAAQLELERTMREYREAAVSLERSRHLLQAILNRSTTVIYVKDTASRFVLINQHFERLFGVSNERIAGKTDYDLFAPEVAATLRANDERVIAGGEPLHFEEVVPQDDGPHTYVSVKFPVRDDAGVIYALCGISTDITDRQAIEADLRRSQATLSAVIESSTDAIFSVDRAYRLVTCNAVAPRLLSALFSGPPRLGVDVREEFPASLAAHWCRLLDCALAGERITVEEPMAVDGGMHHLLVSLNPIVADGIVSGVTAFVKDVTSLKRAEEEARHHQAELAHVLRLQTMGEMAASVAHEINQPLGAIANYAQGWRRRLETDPNAPPDLLQTAGEIAHEALRAGTITRRIRELMRKDAPRREPADINQIVAAALDMIAPTARQRAITVRFHPGASEGVVAVDRIQLEQVVLNLVVNAMDAIDLHTGARDVEVRTTEHTEGVEVIVRDTGVGLETALVEKVFERFFTTKPHGLGMGLAISRSIVEAHGGRLWASANTDGGSTFRFVLPVERPVA